jgi:hypothetical protein
MAVILTIAIYRSTDLYVGPWPLFSSLIFYTGDRIPWTGDQPIARSQRTIRTTQIQNKRPHTSTPQVGFEHKTPAFERAKTVHALDCAATVIGKIAVSLQKIPTLSSSFEGLNY